MSNCNELIDNKLALPRTLAVAAAAHSLSICLLVSANAATAAAAAAVCVLCCATHKQLTSALVLSVLDSTQPDTGAQLACAVVYKLAGSESAHSLKQQEESATAALFLLQQPNCSLEGTTKLKGFHGERRRGLKKRPSRFGGGGGGGSRSSQVGRSLLSSCLDERLKSEQASE